MNDLATQLLLVIITGLGGLVVWFTKRSLDRIEHKVDSLELKIDRMDRELRSIKSAVIEIQAILREAGHTIRFPLKINP